MSGIGGVFENQPIGDFPTVAVDPYLDALNFVPNDVGVPLHDLTLRPGTHRRFSFRATPGTSVEVALRAQEWLPLGVLNASRVGSPGTNEPRPSPRTAAPSASNLAAVRSRRLRSTSTNSRDAIRAAGGARLTASLAPGPGMTDEPTELLRTLRFAAARPGLPGGIGGGPEVFDPLDPIDPLPPVDPLPTPTMPVEVVISTRGGVELGRSTLRADPNSPSPVRFAVSGIAVNEVIDVTFINPNDVAVICSSCTVFVQRRVRTTTTKLRNETFLRVFNGAVRSLCPTITVADGEVRLSLHGDLAHALGLENITANVPESFTGGATFNATDLAIMGQGEMVRGVIQRLREHIKSRLTPIGVNSYEMSLLVDRWNSHVDVEAFIDAVSDAYFEQRLVADAVTERVTPDQASRGLRKRVRDAVASHLEDFPMLVDPHRHHRADPAMAVSYALTAIHGEWGPITLEVDEIRLSLFLAFNHMHTRLPAPHGDLPHDRLTVGTVRPSVHVELAISDFDIDIEVPWWLWPITAGVVPLGAFLVEQGLEELADFLAGKAEKLVPRAIHDLVAAHQAEYGDVITKTLTTIAERDHHFHRAAATRQQFAIATIDDNQLRVPHDPRAGIRPSPLAHIDDYVAPVQPIDHSPAEAFVPDHTGASPEALLNRIDHFVFVMMENRSFDHMLGYLSHPAHGGRDDVDGLDGSSRRLGGDLTGTIATPLAGPFPSFWPNLPHDNESIVRQINGGLMNAFASEYARKLFMTRGLNPRSFLNDPERVLRFQTPDVVTTYERLAREYTICDRWFSSVPAGTYPNRACYYSGVTPSLTNDGVAGEFGYVPNLTVFDLLDHVGVDWKIFESDITFLRVYRNFRTEEKRIRPICEMSDPLPTVTFIDPNFTGFPSPQPNNDDQPDTDVRQGQAFLDRIVRTIECSSHWDSTMLVITYDEHGGFADHVPPPGAPGSSHPPDGPIRISLSHPDAKTYGVRVPTFVVSPLVRAGGVAHQIFDHAAVFRTLLQRFAPRYVNSRIIPERVRRSRHLGEVLVDQQPRVATTRTMPSPQILTAEGARRSRITFEEPVDHEDLAWALNQIGMPRP